MIKIYEIKEEHPSSFDFTLSVTPNFEQNYWCKSLVSHEDFEKSSHVLVAEDQQYRRGISDDCPDINYADTGIWTLPEKAWDWIPKLESSGCRIADNVSVEKGEKQFKLIYAAALLDLFDIENSSNVVWNSDFISWVTGSRFYEWDGPVPLIFQVLYHNRHGAKLNGSELSLSGKSYVSQDFKNAYERRNLTGLGFFEVPRTKAPANFDPVVR